MVSAAVPPSGSKALPAARAGVLRRRVIPALAALALCAWGFVAWRTLAPPLAVPVPAVDLTDMVYCPAGMLRRSAPPGTVAIPAFYIDRFEVTRADYGRFLEANPEQPIPGDRLWGGHRRPRALDADLPVTSVTLHDAQAFARWRGKRLPTTDEWEWAARGSTGRRFPWGDAYPGEERVANTRRAKYFGREPHLTPVGLFESGKSPYGAYDMVGNVEEWTSTRVEGLISEYYFVRGGSYLDDLLNTGTRDTILDTHRPTDIGVESWEPIPDRIAGPSSWESDRGFRCAIEVRWVERLKEIRRLTRDLGARDPVSWFRLTRPAENALREIGRDAIPTLRHAAEQLPPGVVLARVQRLIEDLERGGAP